MQVFVSSNTPSIRHPEQTLLPNVRFTGSLFKLLSGRKLDSKKGSSDSSFLSFRKWSFFYKIFSSFVSPIFQPLFMLQRACADF